MKLSTVGEGHGLLQELSRDDRRRSLPQSCRVERNHIAGPAWLVERQQLSGSRFRRDSEFGVHPEQGGSRIVQRDPDARTIPIVKLNSNVGNSSPELCRNDKIDLAG